MRFDVISQTQVSPGETILIVRVSSEVSEPKPTRKAPRKRLIEKDSKVSHADRVTAGKAYKSIVSYVAAKDFAAASATLENLRQRTTQADKLLRAKLESDDDPSNALIDWFETI